MVLQCTRHYSSTAVHYTLLQYNTVRYNLQNFMHHSSDSTRSAVTFRPFMEGCTVLWYSTHCSTPLYCTVLHSTFVHIHTRLSYTTQYYSTVHTKTLLLLLLLLQSTILFTYYIAL